MIPIFKPYLYQEAKDLAKQAIDNEDIAQGPNIELFENKKKYLGYLTLQFIKTAK